VDDNIKLVKYLKKLFNIFEQCSNSLTVHIGIKLRNRILKILLIKFRFEQPEFKFRQELLMGRKLEIKAQCVPKERSVLLKLLVLPANCS
jgi:hypothetical protein